MNVKIIHFCSFYNVIVRTYLFDVDESLLLGFPSSIPLSWLVGLEVLEVLSKSSSIETVDDGSTGLESWITDESSINTGGGLGACLFFRVIFFTINTDDFAVSLLINFFAFSCCTLPWFSCKKRSHFIQSVKFVGHHLENQKKIMWHLSWAAKLTVW